MKKALFPLVVFLLCAPPLFAGELPGAAASAPAAQAGEKPGDKIPSEDSTLKNFHQVGIGLYGGKLFRGASPVRELAKSSAAPLEDPQIMEAAGQIMAHVKALGINTIISLEDPADTEKNGKKSFSFALEKAAARPAGITLLSHPMNNADFRDMSPEAILAWLKGVEKDINASVKKGGVLFHCAAGHDRTGLVAAYLRITISKWPVERAIAEMRDLGHNWPRYSSNGGKSSWHEEFLKSRFGAAAVLKSTYTYRGR